MCLDGLEQCVLDSVSVHKEKNWAPKVTTVRYADDFVITGATPRQQEYRIKPAVAEFLDERGLKQHPTKTLITNVQNGFDFLGYNFKLYPTTTNSRGLRMLIKPSKKSIQKIKGKIKELFDSSNHFSAGFLIIKRNPMLRGWANYHSCVVASECFKALDRYQWNKVWKWAKKKSGKLGGKRVKGKYFKAVGGGNWVFFRHTASGKEVQLFNLKRVPIKRHQLVLNLNPFEDENREYFLKRKSKSSLLAAHWSWKEKKVLKQTKAMCLVCNQIIEPGSNSELHHVLPKKLGGTDSIKNLVMLHQQCHAQITHTKDPNLMAQFELLGILKQPNK